MPLGDDFHRLISSASGLALTVDPTAAAGTPVTQQPTPTPPVTTPPRSSPVTVPVTVPPAAVTPSLRAKIKGRQAVVRKPVKVVLTSDVDGPVTVRAAGRTRTVQVVDGRAALRVRFSRPGRQKVVVKGAGAAPSSR